MKSMNDDNGGQLAQADNKGKFIAFISSVGDVHRYWANTLLFDEPYFSIEQAAEVIGTTPTQFRRSLYKGGYFPNTFKQHTNSIARIHFTDLLAYLGSRVAGKTIEDMPSNRVPDFNDRIDSTCGVETVDLVTGALLWLSTPTVSATDARRQIGCSREYISRMVRTGQLVGWKMADSMTSHLVVTQKSIDDYKREVSKGGANGS